MPSLGIPELLIIGVIALLIFGPKKLPELGKGLGKSIKDFKDAMSEKSEPENDQAKNKDQDKTHDTVSK